MQHALIIHIPSVEILQSLFFLIDHLGHAFAGIDFVDVNTLVLGVSFRLQHVRSRVLHLLRHTHLVRHKMRIDLRLLHQILQALLLQEGFLLFLLALLHLFVKALLLALHVGQLLVPPLPEGKHLPGELLGPHYALLSIALGSNGLLLDLIHAIGGKLLRVSLLVGLVLDVGPVRLWNILLGNIGPGALQSRLFLLLLLLGTDCLDLGLSVFG